MYIASSGSRDASSVVIPPVVAGEEYVVKVKNGSLSLLQGDCAVDGKPMLLHSTASLTPGKSWLTHHIDSR